MKCKKYKLFAMPVCENSIKAAEISEFSRIGCGRVLIYTDKVRFKPDNAFRITDEDINVLTKSELEWLNECNEKICADFIVEHSDSIVKSRAEFFSRLERELERIKEQRSADERNEENTGE